MLSQRSLLTQEQQRVANTQRLRQTLAERRAKFQARQCAHCQAELFRPESDIICDYMLTDETWQAAGFLVTEVACLKCAEERLGRDLTLEDFTKVILNRTIRWCIQHGIRPWRPDR